VLTFRGLDGRHAVLCIALLCAWLGPGQGIARAHGVLADPAFDLPAQPLERALEQFSVVSGWSVMYPAALADGLSSRAVEGTMPPARALEQLLAGTGLVAQTVGEGRVVVRAAAGTEIAAGPATPVLALEERRRRYGQVQQALRNAFCDDPLLAPGDYSAELMFTVADDGRVHDPELLTGSADARRDRQLLRAVAALQLPSAAASLAQPVTLQILPVSDGRDCGSVRQPLP
jgi:hypothetical protein